MKKRVCQHFDTTSFDTEKQPVSFKGRFRFLKAQLLNCLICEYFFLLKLFKLFL